jgi:protein phosphatase 1 regulatory subunit 11
MTINRSSAVASSTLSQRHGSNTAVQIAGSAVTTAPSQQRTITITQSRSDEDEKQEIIPYIVRAAPLQGHSINGDNNNTKRKKSVVFQEGVIDNENLGRKKSKKCCIFHKQTEFNETDSDQDSTSDDSDSDERTNNHKHNQNKKKRKEQLHKYQHSHDCTHQNNSNNESINNHQSHSNKDASNGG